MSIKGAICDDCTILSADTSAIDMHGPFTPPIHIYFAPGFFMHSMLLMQDIDIIRGDEQVVQFANSMLNDAQSMNI